MLQELAIALSRLEQPLDIVTTDAAYTASEIVRSEWIITQEGNRIQIFPLLRCFTHYYSSFLLAKWLVVNTKKYDLIHIHCAFTFPSIFGALCAICLRVPFVVTPHGNFNPWAIQYKNLKKKWFLNLGGRWLYSKAATIHALSSLAIGSIKNLGINAPVKFIPNGLDTTFFSSLPSSKNFSSKYPELKDRFLFVFLGRLDPPKGLERLIPAFALIYKDFPDAVRLVIAGPDLIGYRPSLESLLEEAGCKDGTSFLGMINKEEKLELFSETGVFCLTSHSEGCSIALLEAMAAGLPCIVSPECNMSAAYRQSALREVDSDDTNLLYKEMSKVYADAELRKELGQNARRYIAEDHNWNEIAKSVKELYSEVLDSKPVIK